MLSAIQKDSGLNKIGLILIKFYNRVKDGLYRVNLILNSQTKCWIRQFNEFEKNHDKIVFSHNLHNIILTEKKKSTIGNVLNKTMFNTITDTTKAIIN